ncbi:MAG: Gfo/Idh/MocA family oxidoreductase [Clostridiales bacterium]|nr:Gfo/Idh/MocA family oxidoreductase [Clostridiales bacterium]
MNDKVRFGIAGIGNMGGAHAENILGGKVKNAELAAVCDINPDRLAWAEDSLTGARPADSVKTFADADEMYGSGLIDAVIIATPHYSHPPLTIAAFKKGLHVMCEKPAGVYTKQVREMNAAADIYKRVFGMMFNQRTDPAYIKIHDMVSAGELGEFRRVNIIITDWYRPQFYYDSGDWRGTWAGEGGGVLLNQCPHNLDLWQWICGLPKSVTAFCKSMWHNIEVEDDVTAYADYENGATGVFVTSTADAPGTNRFEISGTLGKLVYEGGKLTHHKLSINEREFNRTTDKAFGSPPCTVSEIKITGGYPQHCGVLEKFVNKILYGGELVADGREGIRGLLLSNAIHLSSWLGRTVSLPIDEDLFYGELQKRVKNSKIKAGVRQFVTNDMSATF